MDGLVHGRRALLGGDKGILRDLTLFAAESIPQIFEVKRIVSGAA
jgi:hypothetical protein